MEIEPRLKEQNFGRYESTPRDGAEFHEAKKDMASRFGTGESMLQLLTKLNEAKISIKDEGTISADDIEKELGL